MASDGSASVHSRDENEADDASVPLLSPPLPGVFAPGVATAGTVHDQPGLVFTSGTDAPDGNRRSTAPPRVADTIIDIADDDTGYDSGVTSHAGAPATSPWPTPTITAGPPAVWTSDNIFDGPPVDPHDDTTPARRSSLTETIRLLHNDVTRTQQQMAATQMEMASTSRSLEGILDIMSTLVTRDGARDLVGGIIATELVSFKSNMQSEFGGKIDTITKTVQSTASTLGHVTNTLIPGLERGLADIVGARQTGTPAVHHPPRAPVVPDEGAPDDPACPTPTARSRSAYDHFRARNPDLRPTPLRAPGPPRDDYCNAGTPHDDYAPSRDFGTCRDGYIPPAYPTRDSVRPGPIASPRHKDRDCRARELKASRSDITALATVPYHCGFDSGVDTLTSAILADVGFGNISSDDVVSCHNEIIDVHRRTIQLWHNVTSHTFGPQVHRILQKSLPLFPKLESTGTAEVVEFYDRFQETAADHLIALIPFDAVLLRSGFEGLCVPGLGVSRYARMGKALMDLLPRLIPGSLSPQINAALYSVRYESNNGYDYLWRVLELTVPGFDPIIPIHTPKWADYEDVFQFAQAYLLYFRLQSKLNFHYDDRTRSGIFLRSIQHTDYADTVTTLQTQVNTFREFDEGYLPSHLRLHGLATSIHENAMNRLRDIATPRIRRTHGLTPNIQDVPAVYRFDHHPRDRRTRDGPYDTRESPRTLGRGPPRGGNRSDQTVGTTFTPRPQPPSLPPRCHLRRVQAPRTRSEALRHACHGHLPGALHETRSVCACAGLHRTGLGGSLEGPPG